MIPKELKNTDITSSFDRGDKVIFKDIQTEIINSFPLNETEFIYKLNDFGNRWVEGKNLKVVK